MVLVTKGTPCSPTPAWVPGSAPWTATLLLPRLFSRHSLFLLWSLRISLCPSGAPWPGSGRWGERYLRAETKLPAPYPPPHLPTPHTPLPCFHSAHHWGNRPWDGRRRLLPRSHRLPGTLNVSISNPTSRHSPFLAPPRTGCVSGPFPLSLNGL